MIKNICLFFKESIFNLNVHLLLNFGGILFAFKNKIAILSTRGILSLRYVVLEVFCPDMFLINCFKKQTVRSDILCRSKLHAFPTMALPGHMVHLYSKLLHFKQKQMFQFEIRRISKLYRL